MWQNVPDVLVAEHDVLFCSYKYQPKLYRKRISCGERMWCWSFVKGKLCRIPVVGKIQRLLNMPIEFWGRYLRWESMGCCENELCIVVIRECDERFCIRWKWCGVLWWTKVICTFVVRKLSAGCCGEIKWFILLWCEDVLWVPTLAIVVWGVVARESGIYCCCERM